MIVALIIPLDGGQLPPGINNSLPGQGGRPDQGLPGHERPVDPGYGQGGYGRPDQGLPGSQPGIDNSLPGGLQNRPTHPIELPEQLPPPPDEYSDCVVIAVWNPATGQWAYGAAEPAQPKG
jgi:hypothetical protein